MQKLDSNEIAQYDRQGMAERILNFSQQLQKALTIAKSTEIKLRKERIRNICAMGMGGSAISGDIVRSYLSDRLKMPFIVNRYYQTPDFIDEHSLVIASSYSGNTEEILAAYEDAHQRGAQIVCITSGGELGRRAQTNAQPLFLIPPGSPPRAALGYLLVPLLYILYYSGLHSNPEADLLESIELIRTLSAEYHPDAADNKAKQLSRAIHNTVPLIYSSAHAFDAVGLRWKCQFCENSKMLSFCNEFPELNHNEIMGWGPLRELNRKFTVVFLKDRDDHTQVKKRMQITAEILKKHVTGVFQAESQGNSLLSRIFSLIFLGDVISLYLAILNGVNPTSIDNIDYLKEELAKSN